MSVQRHILAVALAVSALLTGCGSADQGGAGLGQAVLARIAPQPAAASLRQVLTPDVIASFEQSAGVIGLPDRGQEALVVELNRRGSTVTWASLDGVSVSTRSGVVVATRGLGGDLMVADLAEVIAGVRGQRAEALRVHRYLDGENQTVPSVLICDYARGPVAPVPFSITARSGPIVSETCTGPNRIIENTYWVSSAGRVFASRQWVGPEVGYLHFETIIEK